MSFFKKLGETAKNTASTIGAKSANLVEISKLKMAKNQHEGKINEKIAEIGRLVYAAHKEGVELDQEKLQEKYSEIVGLEAQIKEIESQMEQLREDTEAASKTAEEDTAQEPSQDTTDVEEKLEAETAETETVESGAEETADPIETTEATAEPATVKKFCTNCGSQLGEGAKFCSGCGQPV